MKKRSMAQKRPRCNTPGTFIHRDILSHIYGFLNSHEEHRACLVCWHWSNVLPRSYCLTKTEVHYATAEAVRNIKEKSSICRAFPGSSDDSLWANLKHASAQMTNQNVKSLLRCARGMETLVLTGSKELTSFGLLMAPWPATLIHLDLTSCSLVTDLNFLAQLPNLRVLKLTNCTGIKHRGGFDVLKIHCRALQVLEMTQCEGLRNVEFLRAHPALTFIDVDSSVDSFEPLATVGTLQVLKTFGGGYHPTSVSFDCFLEHPSLRDIELHYFSFVRVLPTLRCLNSFTIYQPLSELLDGGPDGCFDALNSHPTLRDVYLRFNFSPSSRQLNFIRTLPQLDKLKIKPLPEDFDFLERHPSLRELCVLGEKAEDSNLVLTQPRCIGTIPHLEILTFYEVGGVDLVFLTNHGSLRRLELNSCVGITSSDVSAVATCSKLQHLEITACDDLEDLEFLRNNKTLLSLSVGSITLQSSHLRVLLSVPRLESLDIDLCESVDDISFLAGHPSLLEIWASRTKVTAQNVQCGFRAPVRLTLTDFELETLLSMSALTSN